MYRYSASSVSALNPVVAASTFFNPDKQLTSEAKDYRGLRQAHAKFHGWLPHTRTKTHVGISCHIVDKHIGPSVTASRSRSYVKNTKSFRYSGVAWQVVIRDANERISVHHAVVAYPGKRCAAGRRRHPSSRHSCAGCCAYFEKRLSHHPGQPSPRNFKHLLGLLGRLKSAPQHPVIILCVYFRLPWPLTLRVALQNVDAKRRELRRRLQGPYTRGWPPVPGGVRVPAEGLHARGARQVSGFTPPPLPSCLVTSLHW